MATRTEEAGAATRHDEWEDDLTGEAQFKQLLAGDESGFQALGDLDKIVFSQEGKAQDAQDFEDISDDDLPDEEDGTGHGSLEVPGLTDDTGASGETDDLFGDQPSSPTDPFAPMLASSTPPTNVEPSQDAESTLPGDSFMGDYGASVANDVSVSNQDPDIPEAPESMIELVQHAFPGFEKGIILNFNEQFAPQPSFRLPKKSQNLKAPKPLVPTKLSLEFDGDAEKPFRIPGPAQAASQQRIYDAEAKGQVSCLEAVAVEESSTDIWGVDADDENEVIGGFSLRDIELVCQDWDAMIDPPTPEPEPQPEVRVVDDEDDWEREFLEPKPKRRKILTQPGLPMVPRFTAPNFDKFDEATARAAKRAYLDFEDPNLLIDEDLELQPPAKRPKVSAGQPRTANGGPRVDLSRRFDFSNDQAYSQLKESHQNKIRAQHGAVEVEHGGPALKLLWPYFKILPYGTQPHDYHRPLLQTSQGSGFAVKIAKQHKASRKERKSKRIQEQFATSKDLMLNDNATAALFEYCEEMPAVLSNFGMGSKIINYHRLKSKDGDERPPKLDLGEQSFLSPDDRSPFASFGSVHPGETVPTLHNAMFRAPIFKHAPRPTDFLVGRSTTGFGGSVYHIKKLDHLYVVGQTFPLTEVPGPHSRKVTSLAKSRLRMVAYRFILRNGSVSLQDITNHVQDSNDAQNRQKLKEFLSYDKDTRSWRMQPNDPPLDKALIASLVKPEEICLHDAMQVGQNELSLNGYSLDDGAALDDEEEEGGNEKDKLASQMVPWRTTRNFLEASAGKAMLQLHGAGDPTGRGLAFSFIKTSMKGGYMDSIQGPAATSADAIERERKANGGHSYNVKKQEELYNRAIQKIWGLQKTSLEDDTPHDDEDVQDQEDEDDRFNATQSVAATPAPYADDRMSQISRRTSNAPEKRKLKITRRVRDFRTNEVVTKTEIVHDPGIIAQYMKIRALRDMENIESVNAPILCKRDLLTALVPTPSNRPAMRTTTAF